MSARVLLLTSTTSYRIGDFLRAAERLGVDTVVGSNAPLVIDTFSHGRTLTLNFDDVDGAVKHIVEHLVEYPIDAVVGVDEPTTLLAAAAAKALRLPSNDPAAIRNTHNKYRFRTVLKDTPLPTPEFRLLAPLNDASSVARQVVYPCVLKPLSLSGSRGVIRANDPAEFTTAAKRIRAILQTLKHSNQEEHRAILVETYIPGDEVALEGLLVEGQLELLALFDKPQALEGPYFEETIYVTPSALGDGEIDAITGITAQAANALGLHTGPIHGELRINHEGIFLIELAARSIGGRCSRALTFGNGLRLEDIILGQVLGELHHTMFRQTTASGVMMIPIPRGGRLRGVEGLAAARSVDGIEDVILDAIVGNVLVPLPEGDQYLGFIFAKAKNAGAVVDALHAAHRELHFNIAPT